MLWYEAWGNLPVEVRLATWERDRIGYFGAMRGEGGHLVTCQLAGATEFSANVGGLGSYAELCFELLDEGSIRCPASAAPDAGALRLQVTFAGTRAEDAQSVLPCTPADRPASPSPKRSSDCVTAGGRARLSLRTLGGRRAGRLPWTSRRTDGQGVPALGRRSNDM